MVVVHCQQFDMRFLANRKLWLLAVVVLVPISIVALRTTPASPLSGLPPVIVWAWERPEKLDFINTERVGVAFLAKTLRLNGDRVFNRPRLQPLEVPPGTKLIAVVRIESDHPTFSDNQLRQAVTQITDLSALPNISAVQIDFDATVSQRGFYTDLLNRVRRQLPSSTALSITALASWCSGDHWLSDLPIDEAVPMLFRMGVDQKHFQSTPHFEPAICANSTGVALDEPIAAPAVDRIYIFNPNPWSRESLNRALETYKR